MRIIFNIMFLSILVTNIVAEDDESGFISIFDGKTLNGWEGLPGWWYIEDGAITAQSTPEKPCKNAHYLYWTGGEPEDFILKLEFKLDNNNSGIQFRSERRPNYDTWGYQADIDDTGEWMGCLFQHDRWAVVKRGFKAEIDEEGKRVKEEQFADPKELLKVVKPKEWNEYEIRAIGNHIQLYINNTLMCEVKDNDKKYSRRKGIIALQMHPGPPMKVQFRNIRIKLIKS